MNRLILFTRIPIPEKAKTRLIPALGAEGAAQLQREMTEYILRQARKTGAAIEVRYTGGTEEQMRKWLGDGHEYIEQGGGDLGERMQRAFADAFSNGWQKVVVIGADCPSNDGQNITAAFQALETSDCAIGPASDGGYYLIGLCSAGAMTPPPRSRISATFPAELFQDIDWGTGRVFEQTMRAAAGLTLFKMPMRHDIDLPEDIPSRISVIVPTLNEEAHLGRTLARAAEGFRVELVVADGGSSDGTCAIASAISHLRRCEKNRAHQQNCGAAEASGEFLLFLHADTLLPEGWDWVVRETLADPSVALGAFSFKVDVDFVGRTFIENTANRRSKRWNLPYGDQGLFLRRETFDRLGGFPNQPIMEDYALVRAAQKLGRIVTVPAAAITSGRRWQQHGVWKVTWVNKLMLLGYHLGIPPERLAAFYRH